MTATLWSTAVFCRFCLNILVRRKLAMMVERFELQGSMLDFELAMQVPGRLIQQRAVAIADVPDQMSRKSRFCGAHRPDVKVVHLGYVWKAGEIFSHFGHLNT